MEIDAFEVSKDPVPLTLLHPSTGEKTDIVLQVISPDSPEFKRLSLEEARKGLSKKAEAGEIVEKMIRRSSEMAATVITGWEGIKLKGKVYKYSRANAIKLLDDFPWIATQLDAFLKNRENFFVGSPKS